LELHSLLAFTGTAVQILTGSVPQARLRALPLLLRFWSCWRRVGGCIAADAVRQARMLTYADVC
jgi:hypothetical protein